MLTKAQIHISSFYWFILSAGCSSLSKTSLWFFKTGSKLIRREVKAIANPHLPDIFQSEKQGNQATGAKWLKLNKWKKSDWFSHLFFCSLLMAEWLISAKGEAWVISLAHHMVSSIHRLLGAQSYFQMLFSVLEDINKLWLFYSSFGTIKVELTLQQRRAFYSVPNNTMK